MTLHCETKRCVRTQAGISMVETVIVLSVVGIIFASLWAVVGEVRDSSRVDRMGSLMTVAVANIRDYYKGASGTPSGTLTSDLVENGAIPSELVGKRTAPFTASHLWDQNVNGGTLVVRASSLSRSGLFEIELNSLDQDHCVALSSVLTGVSGPKGLVSSQINSSAVTKGIISPEIAAGRCNAAIGNRIIFSYLLRG